MSCSNGMRQLEERHVAAKIEIMAWSTKMDLLALSNSNGEVILHRLNWLKVWILPSPYENVFVKSLAWRPDGKVIAVGYSNDEVYLVDVENKDILNKTKLESEITFMVWTEGKEENCKTKSSLHSNPNTRELSSKDDYNVYLPKLPSLCRSFSTAGTSTEDYVDDAKKIRDQKQLNLLFVGMKNGKLYVSVFGLYPSAIVDVKKHFDNKDCSILNINTTQDLSIIFVIVSSKENENISKISMLLLDADVLFNNCRELQTLALKYGQIMSLIDYLNQTLKNITEAWENILLEMDSKLTAYASRVSPGVVSSDFLELLMFGIPSPEMEVFLLQELTEKGLKKLGHSIEISYSNIQKLVVRHLHSVGQNLAFHLSELRGMSRCPGYYKMVGLNENYVSAALIATGSFLVKATEVQQVIDTSMKKYKAFFRWLYATILRLSDERVSPEISKVSQQDLQYIAEFLYNFEGKNVDADTSGFKKPKFNLERLGQYLVDSDLEILPDETDDFWSKLLKEKCSAFSTVSIIEHHKNMTLVQEINHLEQNILDIFKCSETLLAQYFNLICVQHCINVNNPYELIISSVYVEDEESFLLVFTDNKPPVDGFYMISMSINSNEIHPKLCLINTEQNTKIIDLQFYLPDVLSILTMSSDNGGFIQFPTKLIKNKLSDFEHLSPSPLFLHHLFDTNHVKIIDYMVVSSFAVSGNRKVAIVLSDSKRKVRLFEMEIEDDEEEDDTMEASNNSTKDNELSFDV